MSEEEIVRHCAPTLAGFKTGNMFSTEYTALGKINRDIMKLNKNLKAKGLRIMPLLYGNRHALIYIYRPEKLRCDLSDRRVCSFLDACGYRTDKPGQCIVRLIKKLRAGGEFPHEIGFFLGYPPEDVIGFIKDRGACKACGCWKVYGDEKSAKETFRRFKACTENLCKMYRNGISMEELAVAI
ncbi:MAG: DUF3793 family protein [Lachnospiraceae bacterium]|nr:DUF3793 family protein [Lachnospiraceae bacterium]